MSLFFFFQRQYRTFVRSPWRSSSRSSNSSSCCVAAAYGVLLPPLHRRSLLSEARGMTMQPPSVTSKFLPSPLVIGPLCRKVDINRARAGAPLSRLSLCMRHRNCIVTILNMHSPLQIFAPDDPRRGATNFFFASECTLEQRYRESEASALAP